MDLVGQQTQEATQTSAGKARRGQIQGRKERTWVASEEVLVDEGEMGDLAQ